MKKLRKDETLVERQAWVVQVSWDEGDGLVAKTMEPDYGEVDGVAVCSRAVGDLIRRSNPDRDVSYDAVGWAKLVKFGVSPVSGERVLDVERDQTRPTVHYSFGYSPGDREPVTVF